jgi:hypothetical protein
MGISPNDWRKMSMWEMAAASERWVAAHDTESHDDRKGKLDEAEKDEIWAWMQQKGATGRKRSNGTGTG